MSITKRTFAIIGCIMSAVLILLNIFTYLLFSYSIRLQLMSSQQSLIEANNTLSSFFIDTLDELVYQYTSDAEIGRLLAMPVGEDSLQDVNTKILLNNLLAYHLNSKSLLLNNGVSCALYVNPELPISQLFGRNHTTKNVSRVFNGELVAGTPWYQAAQNRLRGQYIFLSEDLSEICFACKLQNSFYPGPYRKEGIGVLLSTLPVEQLPNLLAISSVTPNSGILLLNSDGNVVYQSDNLPDTLPNTAIFISDITNENLILDEQRFLSTSKELDWGLHLVYLTPYSDINDQLSNIMMPYLIVSIGVFLCSIFISFLVSTRIARPVTRLAQTIENIYDVRMVSPDLFSERERSLPREVQQLTDSFCLLISRVNSLILQVQETEAQRRKSELAALQAQINPHFMLNAMNAVNHMALMRGQDDIAATVSSIASLMRYSITEPDAVVTLQTEIANIQEYISIYVLRFRQDIRLEVHSELPETLVLIPKFTLQPLVENSIRHGITRDDSGICVHIAVSMCGHQLSIAITDTGKGCDPKQLNDYIHYKPANLQVTHGFGIRNVNERLQLRFGKNSGLHYFLNSENKLTAQLTIFLEEKSTQ